MATPPLTAALVLAAGESRRLGRLKQLEPWGDTTLLGHVIERTRAFPVGEVWVVLGFDAGRIMRSVDLTGCGVVENLEWEEGIASSLRVGLDALTRKSRADAALIVAGDQPEVEPAVVKALVASYRPGKTLAVVPKYRYIWANPVLIDRVLWPRVMSLEGDEGAKRLLRVHPEWVHEVWREELPPRDVDTAADVEDLRPTT